MAAHGFAGLSNAMTLYSRGIEDKTNHLLALAKGYVFYATENSSLFQLMFGKQFADLSEYPVLAEASSKSYGIMSDAVKQQMKNRNMKAGPKIGAAAAWSMMHGLSILIIDNKISAENSGVDSINDLVEQVGEMLIFAVKASH